MQKTWYNSFKNHLGPFLQHCFGRCFTKKAMFSTLKMKIEFFLAPKIDFFVQIKWKIHIEIWFGILICTHVQNMKSFEQTMRRFYIFLNYLGWIQNVVKTSCLEPITRQNPSSHQSPPKTDLGCPHSDSMSLSSPINMQRQDITLKP
jgi:hypothetical protein